MLALCLLPLCSTFVALFISNNTALRYARPAHLLFISLFICAFFHALCHVLPALCPKMPHRENGHISRYVIQSDRQGPTH